jgi:hypothetical protein
MAKKKSQPEETEAVIIAETSKTCKVLVLKNHVCTIVRQKYILKEKDRVDLPVDVASILQHGNIVSKI